MTSQDDLEGAVTSFSGLRFSGSLGLVPVASTPSFPLLFFLSPVFSAPSAAVEGRVDRLNIFDNLQGLTLRKSMENGKNSLISFSCVLSKFGKFKGEAT